MAVVVQCFHCNAVLELDEGFRGGVCRCSTCGSLLQVPKGGTGGGVSTGRKVRPPAPSSYKSGGSAKPPGGTAGISRGQFDPTKIKAQPDLGISSSGLRRIQQARPLDPQGGRHEDAKAGEAPPVPAHGLPAIREIRRNKTLFWTAIGLIVLITAGVVLLVAMYVFRGEPAPGPQGGRTGVVRPANNPGPAPGPGARMP